MIRLCGKSIKAGLLKLAEKGCFLMVAEGETCYRAADNIFICAF